MEVKDGNHLTFIDLFSGCGGMSLGFEMAGFKSVLAIDNWRDALDTYSFNRCGEKTICADLSAIDPLSLKEKIGADTVDVIIGGPPCQGFSIAGKRIVDDERNKLYKSFVGFVRTFKPKAFVMENVPNILGIGGGAVKEAIIKDFEGIGYNVNVAVLTASDFGVPQNRRRAVFVGLSDGKAFDFPAPSVKKAVTSSEALSDLPENSLADGSPYGIPASNEYQRYARKDSKGVYNHSVTVHNDRTVEIISMVPDGGNYKDLPLELQDTRKVHIAWTRLNSKRPSFTIDCGHNHHFHYEYNRVPTVRESARLQSFPDSFVFLGNKGSQLRQVGNAVPPLLAKAVALQLKKKLETTMYNPDNQYRCTIIRGKSQTDMEDLLPLYASMVHRICPCEETAFKAYSRRFISKALFSTESYGNLSGGNKKTVDNHITEIAGTLLGLYYPAYENNACYFYESDSCRQLVEKNDFPLFFKNLCLNFQFPNGAKWIKYVKEDIDKGLRIKPFCYLVSLLDFARRQSKSLLLTKQEIGYYVLNNLDVLRGGVDCSTVYERIMSDRKKGIKRDGLSGSKDWQHIREQFNLLELANIIETDATYVWLNDKESEAIALFLKHIDEPMFDCYGYNLDDKDGRKFFVSDWKRYYGRFNDELLHIKTDFMVGREAASVGIGVKSHGSAFKSTVDLGDEGEALVFRLEKERVRKYKERLVNKVLLLGKTKGLGYDISSIEADENPLKPEFARYIEVKTTKRVTEPKFDKAWTDSLNLTAKEWIAAEQYGEYYNIYRVYFTKNKTIVVRIKNPYKKAQEQLIEVYPVSYQMNFDANVIEKRYAD